ncbi:hypothetical protein ATANTOWER_031097 [Ataeniobius toweri]|uniref:Uncharacterized protein n=1 Tax=Ataeniobius toweri TaxID=208326 RepID=A0ABU7C4D0_9TELE|nr:hypothetical protein [Ataeniobius toweri]
MASGKKSVLLSSLADYGDDSEPDSDPEPEDTGGQGGGLVYGYGEDDLNRTEDVEDKGSVNEDSQDSNSDMDESDEGRDADDVETLEAEKKDPNELVGECFIILTTSQGINKVIILNHCTLKIFLTSWDEI